ncbi:MAG: efflux RND transporter periplasmic adaptor subunit [Acidobacteria bacterium]|nr:efflux RND transporter periplasmic adaptor subunit [Acidobacteriota bacterium]
MRPNAAALIVFLPAALAGCAARETSDAVLASGYIEATEVRVSAEVGGTLEWLGAREGDSIAAGEPLARIDATDLRLALAAARAERDQAAADLALKLAGNRSEDIAEAAAQVERARADLDGAERELARMEGLLDSGSGTEKSRDDARTRREVAAAQLAAARERLNRARAGFRREEIDAARARVAAADARVAILDEQVRDTNIASPVAGVVTERPVERGELLVPGALVAIVTALDDAWLTAYVGERDLGRIRVGQVAQVVTDDGQRRDAHVTYIASVAEFTPKNVQTPDEREKLVYRVKLQVPNKDGLFKPGMPAQARIAAAGSPA